MLSIFLGFWNENIVFYYFFIRNYTSKCLPSYNMLQRFQDILACMTESPWKPMYIPVYLLGIKLMLHQPACDESGLALLVYVCVCVCPSVYISELSLVLICVCVCMNVLECIWVFAHTYLIPRLYIYTFLFTNLFLIISFSFTQERSQNPRSKLLNNSS